MELIYDGRLDDEPIVHTPGFSKVLIGFQAVIDIARQEGISEIEIANAVLNLHVRLIAAMRPNDEQVTQIGSLITDAVIDLRQHNLRTYQMIEIAP